MAVTAVLLRLEPGLKERAVRAAARQGLSLRAYLTGLIERDVSHQTAETAVPSSVLPDAFWAACRTAERGGRAGYAAAGRMLAEYVVRAGRGDELREHVAGGGAPADWLNREYVSWAWLVPRRRLGSFLRGFQEVLGV
jgi:hypothetical protein